MMQCLSQKFGAAFLSAVSVAGLAGSAHGAVVISQVYGGGGSGAAVYLFDYVELHNNDPVNPATLASHSIQYSSTGATWTGKTNLPASVVIPAGGYYLVQMNTTSVGGVALPTPDFIASAASGTILVSGTRGVISLVSNQTVLAPASCVSATVVDLAAYGGVQAPPVTCFEGASNAGATTAATAIIRQNNGCQDTNDNGNDFVVTAPNPRNSASTINTCGGFTDCNNNGISDLTEIAGNPSLDCNSNTQLDSCELITNPALDCNGNSVIDSCDIAANATLDCNVNGTIDSCEIALFADFDGGSCGTPNGIIDSCENATGQDCNANGKKDCWDFKTYLLTDVNANSIADACEGAVVTEVSTNGTVRPAGVSSAANFFNVEGTLLGTNTSYGAVRVPNSTFAPLAGNVGQIWLQLTQHNAAFTAGGLPSDPNNCEIHYTNMDAVNITPGFAGTQFANFATDFSDAASLGTHKFVQGSNPPPALPFAGSATGNGTFGYYKLYDAAMSPTPAQTALANDIIAGTGNLTLLITPIVGQDYVAATYAGITDSVYRGPTLVVFPNPGAVCDGIDFNNDGVSPDSLDIDDFLSVFGGGACSNDPNCGDIDFNNDGVSPDSLDIDSLLSVFGGGACL